MSRDEWALALIRYLHLNPVRIRTLGLGKRIGKLNEWGCRPRRARGHEWFGVRKEQLPTAVAVKGFQGQERLVSRQ